MSSSMTLTGRSSARSASLQMTPGWVLRLMCLRLGCHPERAGQAGGVGLWEPHKVQQVQVQGAVLTSGYQLQTGG